MFVGIDFFGLDNYEGNMNCVNDIYSVQLSNSIVDQISIRKNVDVAYSTSKKVWQPDTILLGDFNNNLEAGNLKNDGVPIIYLLFMKKKVADSTWTKVAKIPYSTTKTSYSFIDKYIASNVNTEYALIPCSVGDIQGDWIIMSITPTFEGTFIFDDLNNYHLLKNLKWDAITTNIVKGRYEPIGAQFPITVFGSLKYKSGKITNTLMTDNSVDELGTGIAGIDLTQERVQTDAFLEFLTNFQPKIIKDGQGRYLLITTDGSPTEIPNNEIQGAISDVSFDFTEIGNSSIENLSSMNLGNVIQN